MPVERRPRPLTDVTAGPAGAGTPVSGGPNDATSGARSRSAHHSEDCSAGLRVRTPRADVLGAVLTAGDPLAAQPG